MDTVNVVLGCVRCQAADRIEDLQARVEWLIKTYATIEDGVFTFPDGETWKGADRG